MMTVALVNRSGVEATASQGSDVVSEGCFQMIQWWMKKWFGERGKRNITVSTCVDPAALRVVTHHGRLPLTGPPQSNVGGTLQYLTLKWFMSFGDENQNKQPR